MRPEATAVIVIALGLVPPVASDEKPTPAEKRVEQGRAQYEMHCQSCHGVNAEGDGPMAEKLTPRPPDLTRLRDADGNFPAERIHKVIDGRESLSGHQRREMPIWGLNFQQLDRDTNQEEEVRRTIERIVAYLESIQRP